MREHIGIFRGKRIDNGEWVEGCLLYDSEQNEAFIAEFFEDRAAYIREVDPTTIGECTGLKDKNGKLIFEGDIVRVYGADLPYWIDDGEIREVKYDGNGYTPFSEYDSDCGEYVCAKDCEIIGNVVDNPELLGGGEG